MPTHYLKFVIKKTILSSKFNAFLIELKFDKTGV